MTGFRGRVRMPYPGPTAAHGGVGEERGLPARLSRMKTVKVGITQGGEAPEHRLAPPADLPIPCPGSRLPFPKPSKEDRSAPDRSSSDIPGLQRTSP
jgi:hypothetical protein